MREVEFWITGVVNRFKGVVVNENGKYGKPEIKVTHRMDRETKEWVPDNTWQILKDGDYILL